MSRRYTIPFVLLALAFLVAAFAQQAAEVIGWYNGDWQSGIPGLSNSYNAPGDFARIYDQFQVPDGGWTIIAVYSDNALYDFPPVTSASWEIRRGMAPGQGGETIASGVAQATQMPDPAVTTPKYPATEASNHFRVLVSGLQVQLPPGRYWLSVAPVGTGKAYASPTLGLNAVGVDQNGPGIALFDRPSGPRFAIAEAVARAGQMGITRHFSQGVIVAK